MSKVFRIKELRKEAKMTQAELAKKLNLKSPSTICLWENGQRKPPSDKLPEIAKALSVNVNEIYKCTERR